ncbi:hypothetical protein V1511DRAFT_491482 [Dipodascopsis uninucleata]
MMYSSSLSKIGRSLVHFGSRTFNGSFTTIPASPSLFLKQAVVHQSIGGIDGKQLYYARCVLESSKSLGLSFIFRRDFVTRGPFKKGPHQNKEDPVSTNRKESVDDDANLIPVYNVAQLEEILKKAQDGTLDTKDVAQLRQKPDDSLDVHAAKSVSAEEYKPHSNGLILAIGVLIIMFGTQVASFYDYEFWSKYASITIPSSPSGTEVKLEPIALLMNVFSTTSTGQFLTNTFIGYYAIRASVIALGTMTTMTLLALFAAWGNRSIFYEAEKSYTTQVQHADIDGDIVQEKVRVCKGVQNATSNTVMIFSIASLSGLMFPNTFVPLLGPCPLLALPMMGLIADFVSVFRLARESPTLADEGRSLLNRAGLSDLAHLYGVVAGATIWFLAIRWSAVGRQIRSNRKGLQYAISNILMRGPGKWKIL